MRLKKKISRQSKIFKKGNQCKVGILLGKVYDRSGDHLQEVHA